LAILLLVISRAYLNAQSAPAADENIPYLVTFGTDANTSWGDNNFCQIFFFLVPDVQTEPVYLRVYDPDTGGDPDEAKGEFNTIVSFSVYGGKGCWSASDVNGIDTVGNSKSGIMLTSKSFGSEATYDQEYYSFGPFNPYEGEYIEKFGGRVFKIIAQGKSGDDGNLYRYFLSTEPDRNVPVEGGNLFTYEYTFRLPNDQHQVSQIYPFVDDKTISVEVSNFDWDNDGEIRIISVAKNNLLIDVSGDNTWKTQKFPVVEEEKNTTIEIQFVKNRNMKIVNNNVVVVVRNQYGISLPFFVIPIGGIPLYTPKIMMKGIQ